MQNTVSSTEIKAHFGKYLERALSAPVHITKTNRNVAVLMSETEYERLSKIEDACLAQMAKEASIEGYASKNEVAQLIKRLGKNES
jgi:prevent-host-death family protein